MDQKQSLFRTLMFPWLAHGHIFPFLELAKLLSKSNFQIYFCSTAINLDSIKKTLNRDESHVVPIELVELKLPSLQELPPHYHTTKNIPPHLMPTLGKAFQDSKSNFSNIIANLKPDLLIYDAFQPWSAKLASSLGIPSVYFATSGSTTCSFFHHLYTHKSYDSFPYKGIYMHEYEKRDLIVHGRSIKVEDIEEGFAFGIWRLSSEIVLIKSCRGLEGKYIDYLSTLCNRRILPIGPLVVRNQENVDSETIHWLSQKDEFSTLYISFGSENYLSKKQIQEIAKGLELTNVNFIWVDRSPGGSENAIEEALSKGLKDRGKVVKGWANQVEILAHKSVGCFMSHCGWSSIIESLYFGVPVVAMPLKLDQPVNSRLVLDGGFGVEVIRDENGEFDGEGVGKAINMVFLGESGERIRERVRDLREKMRVEEEEGACGVVEELTRICMKKGRKGGDED